MQRQGQATGSPHTPIRPLHVCAGADPTSPTTQVRLEPKAD